MHPAVKPLIRLKTPSYPTWDLVRMNPGLLAREIPARWRGKERLAAAIAAAAFGLGGIGAVTACADENAILPPVAVTSGDGVAPTPVAVMFEYGEGRGSFGCVAVSPPAFLSEAEAREVINAELTAAGLALVADAKTLKDVTRKRLMDESALEDRAKGTEWKGKEEQDVPAQDLVLDGFDAARGVGFEYISEDDYDGVGGLDPYRGSTVSCYDFKDAARNLLGKLNGRDDGLVTGVFYDPMVRAAYERDADGRGYRVDNEAAKDALRSQVRDFAAWLKGQGILQ